MFGADVAMLKPVTFLVRISEDVLGFRRERQFDRGGDLLTQKRASFDLLTNRLNRNLRAREKPSGQRFVLAHQSQQQVFGLDCRSAELRSLVTCEENNPSRFFCVAFEHLSVGKTSL